MVIALHSVFCWAQWFRQCSKFHWSQFTKPLSSQPTASWHPTCRTKCTLGTYPWRTAPQPTAPPRPEGKLPCATDDRGHGHHHGHHLEGKPPNLWARDDWEAAVGGWGLTCSWQRKSSTICRSASTTTRSCLPFVGCFWDPSVERCLTQLVSVDAPWPFLQGKTALRLPSKPASHHAECWMTTGKKSPCCELNLMSTKHKEEKT